MRRSPFARVLKSSAKSSSSGRNFASSQTFSKGNTTNWTEVDTAAYYQRKRKTEWKRRQRGQSFLDYTIINVRGGSGGNGCVAFHREKFVPYGPPSGGNGGRGGDVYVLPTPHLTTLSSVPKRIVAENGTNGMGSWQNGRHGSPYIIKVPLGTVVKELPRHDPRRSKDEYEAEEEGVDGLTLAERRQKIRNARWLHYPGHADENVQRDTFKEAEWALFSQERERRRARRLRSLNPISLDLDKVEETTVPEDSPLGTGHHMPLGHLIASGGTGGLGNPHFLSRTNRSPKFATRGYGGERVTLSLELKLLADIGLVGFPNAGKSTVLRALTGGRAKTEVASYAFTTLNPVVGVVRVADGGNFEGAIRGESVYEETSVEGNQDDEDPDDPVLLATSSCLEPVEHTSSNPDVVDNPMHSSLSNELRPGHQFDLVEKFRFTIADNPGLISRASENVGLGHSFLRSMERSLALVYVVDLSGPAPWDDLRVLRHELDEYKHDMSRKARMVLANKADLLGGVDDDPAAVEGARQKLRKLEAFAHTEFVTNADHPLDVIPISAKFSQNLRKAVGLLRKYVEEARAMSPCD